MGKGFVMVENLLRGYPLGEPPFHRNPFFIRVIREGMRFVTGAPWDTQDAVAERTGTVAP